MCKDILSKRFCVYLIRWIISGFVMMPFMLIMQNYGVGLSLNIILGQVVGAIIFYKIDEWIFRFKQGE